MMKKFCIICVLIAGAMNAATSQTQRQRVEQLTQRVDALEKYVRENLPPKVSTESIKKCRTKRTVRALFGPVVRDIKLCAPQNRKTPTVKILPMLLRRGNYVLITPASRNGVPQAFRVKVRGRFCQETFTRPILINKEGRKINIQ